MDAYCYALSTIKKLGYICDTLLYLTDYQYRLFSRRSSKNSLIFIKIVQPLGLHDFFLITLAA
jgi:hypothetical protein